MPKTATRKKAVKKTRNRISGNGATEPESVLPEAPATKVSKKDDKSQKIEIVPIELATFKLPIRGTTELIVHKFSAKAQKAIEDKQGGKTVTKEHRNPKQDYLESFYMISGKPEGKRARYGVPAGGFKNAAVSACRFLKGFTMVMARGAFQVIADDQATNLVEVFSDSGPHMRTDTVRLAGPGGSLDMRYRPGFADWSCVLTIQFNTAVITAEQIVNLYNNAGFGVGLCEWRPERNGSFGMFEVDSEKLAKLNK